MFQFPWSASAHPMDSGGGTSSSAGGLPHSEISGSMLTYSSPKHIGVRPVLHRLLAPRHPPCALSSLLLLFLHGDTNKNLSHPVFRNLTKDTHMSFILFLSNFQSATCILLPFMLLAATRNNITWPNLDCKYFFRKKFFHVDFPRKHLE